MKKSKIFLIAIISILLVILVGSFALAKTMGEKQHLDENGQIEVSTLSQLFGGFSNVYCVEHYQQMKGGTYTKMATIEINGNETKITVPGQKEPIFTGNNSYSNKVAACLILDTLDDIENYDGVWKDGRWYSAGQIVLWDIWNTWRNGLNDAARSIIKACPPETSYESLGNAAMKVVEEYAENNSCKAKIHYIGILPEYNGDNQSTNQKLILVEDLIDIPKTDVPVKKVWVDNNDQDGIRPNSIQVKLLANGEDVKDSNGNLKTITLNEQNNWYGEFTKLNKQDKDGKDIEYTVEEIGNPSGYVIKYGVDIDIDPDTITITNTHEPEKVEFLIEKQWQDGDDRDGLRAKEVKVDFIVNNQVKDTIILNESNEWKYETGKLDKYSDGEEIKYEFKETTVLEGYENSINVTKVGEKDGVTSYKVIANNKHTPELTEIPVQKEWDDEDDRDGKRPVEIQVTLKYPNGDKVTTDADGNTIQNPVILNESNGWYHNFTNLYKYENHGQLIGYQVEETRIKEERDYEEPVVTGDSLTGYIVTNKHVPERMRVQVIKEWIDEDDLDEYRRSIQVTLYGNGTKVTADADGKPITNPITLSEENNWTYTFENLYRYENKEEINYTVEEEIIEHYNEESGQPNYERSFTEAVKATENTEGQTALISWKITNTHKPHYDGYIEISGKVWLDKPDGKGNNINGKLDKEESGLEGIKVTLKDAQGNQFDVTSTTTTDKDGNYTIRVNYDNSQNVYKLYEDATTVKEKIKTSYVEFEYDGMKYTTVATATSGEDTSKAVENETVRNRFDSAHSKVEPSTQHPDNWIDKNITAITKNVISFETYADKTETTRQEVLKYCNGDGTYIRTNPEGAWNEILPGTRQELACTNGNPHSIREYEIQVELIQNVNLGLFEREQPDVAIFSDLSKVVVTMNNQQYTYLYNVRSNENNNVGLQVKFENKDTYTYRRPVNPADIAYLNQSGNGEAMTVEVTYEVRVGNLSTTLPVTVHNIINSYDSRYTLKTSGWTATPGAQFNQATYNGDLNIKLEPQTESEIIELTYSVSSEAIKGLLNQEATLNNAVEIQSYSTVYGANTLYAEQRTGGRTNQPYGGYDYDSHPGNAEIFINAEGRLEAAMPEDDTDIAPSFVLCKDGETIISGNVWEDTDSNTSDDERIGDGNKGEGEKNLANAKVELYNVKEDGTTELAKLYYSDGKEPTPAVTYSDNDGNYRFGENASCGVVTDTYMIKFTYGEGIDGSTTSTIDGLSVNARNYKSTIISSNNSTLYNIFKNEATDDEWHLKTAKGYSIAVDDIQERVKIEDLQYSNFSDAIHMYAYSKPFELQVEFDSSTEKTKEVGTDGETGFGNELNIFDFGIIERAREDIFVEKTIDNIKIALANGQVLIEGNPKEKLDYVKAIGFDKEINSGREAREAAAKRMVIEIDTELMQQAQLDIRYLITVTNNSEVDYDYYVDDQIKTEYYYFGTNNEGSPIIKGSVETLIDYIDTDYNFKWEYSENWKEATEADLSVVGKELISVTTLEQLTSNKYKAYITEMFREVAPGESKSDYAYASKSITNEDENKYENHIEILKLNAKIARTISTDESGKIITKQYKPGNYVPSLEKRVENGDINNAQAGLHEQDDDRVEVFITPPTGATNYIINYIIVGLAGLILISLGVLFIKKKVLTK